MLAFFWVEETCCELLQRAVLCPASRGQTYCPSLANCYEAGESAFGPWWRSPAWEACRLQKRVGDCRDLSCCPKFGAQWCCDQSSECRNRKSRMFATLNVWICRSYLNAEANVWRGEHLQSFMIWISKSLSRCEKLVKEVNRNSANLGSSSNLILHGLTGPNLRLNIPIPPALWCHCNGLLSIASAAYL